MKLRMPTKVVTLLKPLGSKAVLVPGSSGLAVGLVLGLLAGLIIWGGAAAFRGHVPFPMADRLGANLYMQTSAEYRACCWQAFNTAAMRLEGALAARSTDRPPAVIMDLDETVLDNGAFQSFLFERGLEYSDKLWYRYEKEYPDQVRLVAGAKEFIQKAETMGATVVFISNRHVPYREQTIEALARLGVNTKDINPRLYLRQQGAPSDKTARRKRAETEYEVLLYVGDDLRDFSEQFAAPKVPSGAEPAALDRAIAVRLQRVDEARQHWGHDCFVVPNPCYGNWESLLGDRPVKRLRPSHMGETGSL